MTNGTNMTPTLEEKAVELVEKLEALAEPAAELAIRTAQANALAEIITGLIFLAVSLAVARAMFVVGKLVLKMYQAHDETAAAALGMFGGTGGLFAFAALFGAALSRLADAWNWIGLVAPELYLAKSIIDGIGG